MFSFVVDDHAPTEIDSGISQAVREVYEISMTKNILGDNRIETTVLEEKTNFKRNTITGEFQSLYETLGYIMVRGDIDEHF